MSSDPGPQPEPTIEPGEPLPGGPDSLADEDKYGATSDEPAARDLDPAKNPSVEDHSIPEGVTEADDKQQEPSDEDDADGREPAEDADGEPEPPA